MAEPNAEQQRVSLLIELQDRPGELMAALAEFSRRHINLTHIESRPARDGRFDFYVDCEGRIGDRRIAAAIGALDARGLKLLVLHEREVPWFPRVIDDLARIAGETLDAGADLDADHPGFHDTAYRARRAELAAVAGNWRHGGDLPAIAYRAEETSTWRTVHAGLQPLHQQFACAEYLRVVGDLTGAGVWSAEEIPQARDVSAFLQQRTGFQLWPVAGLLSPRGFLNALAFRVFFATQYIRHGSKPMYTPEPDVCHELIGHAPMFADPAFADFSQEIGLASLGASDAEIERLARCYWYSVEFGLLREGGAIKAYGAGLLSSPGELEHACGNSGGDKNAESAASRPAAARFDWQPADAATRQYPITTYQPTYYVAESLIDARVRLQGYCHTLPRPFYARHNPITGAIWVDRAVRAAPLDPRKS